MPKVSVVERTTVHYEKFTSVGPLLEKLGNGGKGMNWETAKEVEFLRKLNKVRGGDGVAKNQPRLDTAIDAAEMILTLAPETNGEVAVKHGQHCLKTLDSITRI